MSAINRGLKIGKQLNDFLREKKLIPHGKAIFGSPRLQRWLCGFIQAYCELLKLDEAETHGFKSAVCVTMFDGTLIGQQMGLDVLIDTQRVLVEGSTGEYNELFFEFMKIGTADAKPHSEDADNSLLIYSLL
tara:strand:+ start:235 stop:630 length:396 start_codon:yes stop_codon:yes gene_type:complete